MRSRTPLIVGACLALASAAAAQDRRPDGPPPPPPLPRACMDGVTALTDAQRTRLHALADAFHDAHAAQLDSLRAIGDRARAAREAGGSREDVRAIMESGRPIVDALAPARDAFEAQATTVLTAEQLAAGCAPRAPGAPTARDAR